MNRTLKLGRTKSYAVAIAAGVLLLGGYSQKSEAGLCSDLATYADLVGTGTEGCTIDDKTFSNFIFESSSSGGTGIAASTVAISAIDGSLGGDLWGFQFNFSLNAKGSTAGPLFADIFIAYDIACTNQEACITSVHGDVVGGASDGGAISMAETYSAGQGGAFLYWIAGQTPNLSFEDNFVDDPVATLHVEKDLNATCQNSGPGGEGVNTACLASISYIRNTVDQNGGGQTDDDDDTVPEPASLLLLATGLLGLGWARRSRRNQV